MIFDEKGEPCSPSRTCDSLFNVTSTLPVCKCVGKCAATSVPHTCVYSSINQNRQIEMPITNQAIRKNSFRVGPSHSITLPNQSNRRLIVSRARTASVLMMMMLSFQSWTFFNSFLNKRSLIKTAPHSEAIHYQIASTCRFNLLLFSFLFFLFFFHHFFFFFRFFSFRQSQTHFEMRNQFQRCCFKH